MKNEVKHFNIRIEIEDGDIIYPAEDNYGVDVLLNKIQRIIFIMEERKLTDDEVNEIEDFVNDAIKKAIPVERVETTFKQAKEMGGYGIHKADEDEVVSVYKIDGVDYQICGGPHANNTSELVNFKIAKQEAVSAGVRRIKAVINF